MIYLNESMTCCSREQQFDSLRQRAVVIVLFVLAFSAEGDQMPVPAVDNMRYEQYKENGEKNQLIWFLVPKVTKSNAFRCKRGAQHK